MDDDRRDLVRKLFALLTGLAEDAATAAADGQAAATAAEARDLAAQVIESGQRLVAIAEAVTALTDE